MYAAQSLKVLQASLLLSLLLIPVALVLIVRSYSRTAPVQVSNSDELPLATEERPAATPLRFKNIPPWLFVHVSIIAAFQILALLAAAARTEKGILSRSDTQTIQFLCEIPMYLGLFGTLLGVCLTQFISGTLVAPLAYLTTMTGIVLHIIGKLYIWLPIAGENALND